MSQAHKKYLCTPSILKKVPVEERARVRIYHKAQSSRLFKISTIYKCWEYLLQQALQQEPQLTQLSTMILLIQRWHVDRECSVIIDMGQLT